MNQVGLVQQLKNLEQIQEIDLKIDSIKSSQDALPVALKKADASIEGARTQMAALTLRSQELEKAGRQTTAALELNHDRVTRAAEKLENVHNSQEFQAANKEIEQLKKLKLSLEEQNKKSVEELEALTADIAKVAAEIESMQQARDTQASAVMGQETQLKSEVDELDAERKKFSSQVEPRILRQYDRVRSARNGVGVVPAVGGRCKACNMMLPPQLFNEIQGGEVLHSCPSCNRLLFGT